MAGSTPSSSLKFRPLNTIPFWLALIIDPLTTSQWKSEGVSLSPENVGADPPASVPSSQDICPPPFAPRYLLVCTELGVSDRPVKVRDFNSKLLLSVETTKILLASRMSGVSDNSVKDVTSPV